jgi:hypothetical protein
MSHSVRNHAALRWFTAVAMCLSACSVARADEAGGWKLPNLNPFARPAGPPTSSRVSNGGGIKLPKLLPGSASSRQAAAAKAKGPSAWQKMTSGAKSMASKTADVLNPFDDAKDNEPVRVTGSKNAFRQAAAKKDEQSGSWMPSLWGQKDEPPKSVNDFLNRPRPQP